MRTMSLYGESVDSVPAQISSVLLRASRRSSPSYSAVSTTFTSRLPRGEPRGSLPARSQPTHHTAALLLRQKVPTDRSDAKLTDLSSSHDSSARCLPEKAPSPQHLSSPSASLVQVLGTSPEGSDAAQDKKCLTVPPQQADSAVLPGEGAEPVPSGEAELQGLGEGTEVQVSAYTSCPVPRVLGSGLFWGMERNATEHLSVMHCCLQAIIQWLANQQGALGAVGCLEERTKLAT